MFFGLGGKTKFSVLAGNVFHSFGGKLVFTVLARKHVLPEKCRFGFGEKTRFYESSEKTHFGGFGGKHVFRFWRENAFFGFGEKTRFYGFYEKMCCVNLVGKCVLAVLMGKCVLM